MGKVASRMNRQWYRFNAENRAQRVISKDKPEIAPQHPSSVRAMEEILKETSSFIEQERTKDSVLDEYLKKVYVVSQDPPVNKTKFSKPSQKSMLPAERSPPGKLMDLGYLEPTVVPNGKVTLKQLMQLLADNQDNPQINNVSRISEQYKLAPKDSENILQYFSSFKLHIKDNKGLLTSSNKAEIFDRHKPLVSGFVMKLIGELDPLKEKTEEKLPNENHQLGSQPDKKESG